MSIEVIRWFSVGNLAIWIIVAGATIPVLWRAYPRQHPLIALLLILATIDLVLAGVLLDSAFSITRVRGAHGTTDSLMIRILHTLAAVAYGAVLQLVARRRW